MNYNVKLYPVDLGDGEIVYFAECADLKGCAGQGDTPEEALKELQENMEIWLEVAKEEGIPIPKPKLNLENNYSGKFTVRVGKSTHKKLSIAAEEDGVSINQFINDAIVEKLGYNQGVKDFKLENRQIVQQVVNEAIQRINTKSLISSPAPWTPSSRNSNKVCGGH
jgi:antitoxin HicB